MISVRLGYGSANTQAAITRGCLAPWLASDVLCYLVMINSDQTKARNGVWTPWAQILCVECDYETLKDSPRHERYSKRLEVVAAMNRTAEVERPDGDELAVCNKCRCLCWARFDVAMLQKVGFLTSDIEWSGSFGWNMEQTGGMCAALVFTTDTREIVLTAMDGEFLIGEYEIVDETDERWMDALRTWTSDKLYAADGEQKTAAELGAIADQCARKVLEFVNSPAVKVAP